MATRDGYVDFLAACAAGLLAFLLYADTAVLNPLNTGWLLHHDSAQHLYGLLYFTRDAWSLPPGRLFSYGEGFAISVFYTDSIPLLAIAIKVVASVTRSYPLFQPFGWWFLLCFILQAWFSFRLARLFIRERSICVLIAFLACFSPPLLVRGMAHESLMAHWLVIWALMLCLDEGRQQKALVVWWPLLLVVSLGVHPYLFFMCAGLWISANLHAFFVHASSCRRVAMSAACTIAGVFVCAYLYGCFMPTPMARWGYGDYKMNLLAPLNPMGWSLVLPSFRDMTGGEYEGFSYFGLGLLVLLLVASVRRSTDRTFRFGAKSLFTSLVVGTAIAVTPILHIGTLRRRTSLGVLFVTALVLTYGLVPMRAIPGAGSLRGHLWRPILSLTALLVGAGLGAVVLIPFVPESVVGLVRGSGRLFWPTWYFYVFLSCVLVARTMAWRHACLLLAACALLQVADLSPGVVKLNRTHFSAGSPASGVIFVSKRLTGALETVLTGKRHLSILADGPNPLGWEQLGWIALRAGAGIDKAYYARVPLAYEETAAARLREVDAGLFRNDTLYLAYPNYRNRVDEALAGLRLPVRRMEVDGYLIVWSD